MSPEEKPEDDKLKALRLQTLITKIWIDRIENAEFSRFIPIAAQIRERNMQKLRAYKKLGDG